MEARLDYSKVLPEGMKAIYAMNHYSKTSGLEASLLELVKMRASQVNGCAYCLDMHSKDARSGGETEQRLYGLSAWREMPFYTPRERAALALTEAVTVISNGPISDELYAQVREQFSEEETVKLMINILMINTWNRLAITFRDEPGTYLPDHFTTQAAQAPLKSE